MVSGFLCGIVMTTYLYGWLMLEEHRTTIEAPAGAGFGPLPHVVAEKLDEVGAIRCGDVLVSRTRKAFIRSAEINKQYRT